MTTKTKGGLRRAISLAAFTALIAAVTMAFADTPNTRTSITLSKAKPALSTSPVPTIRLAEAPTKKSKSTSVSAKKSKAASAGAKKSKRKGKALEGSLNINTATAIEFTKLPGIGPKKASLILRWRKQHGKFGRVVDLRRVKGFGQKSVKKLLPYLSISGKSTLH